MSTADQGVPDPFGTDRIRDSVLAAWGSFPSRFTEDVATEADHVRGSYRDRLLVELAQNAADAAVAAGCPGSVWFDLRTGDDAELVVSNIGAPLDAAGVAALASLRASGKGDRVDEVGRFGVGFTAVLTVTDEPQVHSSTGSVGFSRARTQDAVAHLSDLQLRPGEQVPVLRLPFPVPARSIPDGYTTSVVLPLRDGEAARVHEALRALAEHPGPLLLGLPALKTLRITADGQDLLSQAAVTTALDRWQIHREQDVVWALPPDPAAHPATLHAPTPTDEPVTLPPLLIATGPVEPGRRRLRRGPAATDLATRAGVAYAGLLEHLVGQGWDDQELAAMAPHVMGQDWFDSELRQSAAGDLSRRRLLRSATDVTRLVPADHAVTLDLSATPTTWAVLAGCHAGRGEGTELVLPGPVTTALRVPAVTLEEVVAGLDPGDVTAWLGAARELLPLAEDPSRREELALLPIPLAGGRVARGGRGVVLTEAPLDPQLQAALEILGVTDRLLHPEVARAAAADPGLAASLERLGVRTATARTLLTTDQVQTVVADIARRLDETDEFTADDDATCRAVLDLVAAAWQEQPWLAGELAWLRELVVTDDAGEPVPTWSVLWPDGILARLAAPEDVATLDPDTAALLPVEAWRALGVADIPVSQELVDLDPDAQDPDELDEVPGADHWWDDVTAQAADEVGTPLLPATAVVVRDLDVVDPPNLPELLRWIDTDPAAAEVRRAVTTPQRLAGPRGATQMPSQAGWWLGEQAGIRNRVPPDSPWAGVLDVIPQWAQTLNPDLLTALGLRDGVAGLPAQSLITALDGLAGPDVNVARLLELWRVAAATQPCDKAVGEQVWALDRQGVPVRVAADRAVVVDAPYWLDHRDPVVVAPAGGAGALARFLDLEPATERYPGQVQSQGEWASIPATVAELLPGVTGWWEHDRLVVDGVDVPWWIDDDGAVHGQTLAGLAAGACWASGRWQLRHAVVQLLLDEPGARRTQVDSAWVQDGWIDTAVGSIPGGHVA